ncbi:MAG: tyrosine-type recombinase/integrase [Terriglobales bacterium]
MSLYRRGGVWWFEFRAGGRRHRASTHATNRRAAAQIEAAARLAIAQGRAGLVTKRQPPRLADFLPRVAAHAAAQHPDRPGTVRWYAEQCRYLAASPLGRLTLDAITGERIAAYGAWRLAGHSVSYANHGLRVLRRALRLAAEWGELERAPVVHALRGERRREAVLEPAAESRYLEELRPELAPIAALMITTGLRPSEAVHAEWRDVDAGGWLTVPAARAKSHRDRRVPLTSAALALLARQPHLGARVWPAASLGAMQRDHGRVCRMLGIAGLPLYGLRHTALTRMAVAGVDAATLQSIAGHASITTTQRYLHPGADALAAARVRLEAPRPPTKLPTPRPEPVGAQLRRSS